jgi:hypothetical protein
MPITRCYAADRVVERPLLGVRGNFYTDTMDGRLKSLDGNKYAHVFATRTYMLQRTRWSLSQWLEKGDANLFMITDGQNT